MMKKLATAVMLATASSATYAASVTTWDLQDFDSDGLKSDFAFYAAPSGASANTFGPAGETCGGGACVPIAMNTGVIGINTFTTGFNFGGTGDFAPNITGNIAADITGGVLTFSALDFGGVFPAPSGTQFVLPPNGGPGSASSTVTDLGGGNFGVVVTYVSTINDPGGSFHNFAANWRLEGVMSTNANVVPIPAAAWLFGSALVGLVGVARRKRQRI